MAALARLRAFALRHASVRRAVTIPLLVSMALLMLVGVPLLAVATAPVNVLRGRRWRTLRIGCLLAAYVFVEAAGLVAAARLWVRYVAGRRRQVAYQQANHELLARALAVMFRASERIGGARVLIDRAPDQPLPAGPLVVVSRHGGPGSSFLLVHLLIGEGLHKIRVVLKDTLAFDPFIDVVLGRVPHLFIRPDPSSVEQGEREVGALAEGLGPGEALVVFPEGGNFTVRRKRRAVARLWRRGLAVHARRAERLRHLLPPRPAGVFAAIDAAPGVDVLFVALTGLDHLASVADVWQAIPLTVPARVAWWTVPAARVPSDAEERLRWLEDNWAHIDDWVDRHRVV